MINGNKTNKKPKYLHSRSRSLLIKLTYLLTFLNLIIFIWLLVLSSSSYNNNTINQHLEIVPDCLSITSDSPLSYWQNGSFGVVSECLKSTFSEDSFNFIDESARLNKCQSDELKHFWHPPNDFFTFTPISIIPSNHKKVISFSLYGGADRYLHNVVKIVRRYKKLLPGWIPRFWLGSDVPFLMINRLIIEEAEVIIVHQRKSSKNASDHPPSFHGMFWRFFVADDTNVQRYIVRDSDSMLIQREVDAINEWIKEDTMFHVMRDHKQHAIEILGGMWGGKVNTKIFSVSQQYEKALNKDYRSKDNKGLDQEFLKAFVWPIARRQMTCHTAYRWKSVDSRGCKDFPTKRVGTSFIGAIMES